VIVWSGVLLQPRKTLASILFQVEAETEVFAGKLRANAEPKETIYV